MSPGTRSPGTLAWIDLSAPDVDAAAHFYARLLGWALETDDTPMGRYVIGTTDAGPVGGIMAPPTPQEGAQPGWSPFFAVADVAATFDRACRLGATGLQPPTGVPGGARIAVVADPAGAVVGFIESHAGDPMAWGRRGAVGWVETQSRDVDASARFYADLLGWAPGPETDGYRLLRLGADPVAGLMPMPPEVPAEVPSYWLVYFVVDDLDEACRCTEELGGGVLVPPMTVQDMRFAVLGDPVGAVFAVLETTAAQGDRAGP